MFNLRQVETACAAVIQVHGFWACGGRCSLLYQLVVCIQTVEIQSHAKEPCLRSIRCRLLQEIVRTKSTTLRRNGKVRIVTVLLNIPERSVRSIVEACRQHVLSRGRQRGMSLHISKTAPEFHTTFSTSLATCVAAQRRRLLNRLGILDLEIDCTGAMTMEYD